jgi:hypothetical protein
MIQQRLLILASCLLACFLFSCKESNNEEKLIFSARDSVNTAAKESGFVVNNDYSPESAKTGSCFNIPAEKINSLSDIKKRISKKVSYFVIKTNRDTVIKCKEGTLLSIPAGAFLNVSDQRPLVGEVKISVREFYKISDMMMEGLTTTSDNQLLETAGMIYIKATSKENNDSCILKPGKNITIGLANSDTNNVDRMQLFNGVHSNSNITWVPRPGLPALAQGWRFRGNNFPQKHFQLNAGFIFPDAALRVKPPLINSKPEDLQAEIKISVRDLVQHVGVVTKKAKGYIDTSGTLRCYKIGDNRQPVSFTEIYNPTTYQNMKINLAVDVSLSYKSNLNHYYFQKLFKMGKGNPDSLVAITATLNPAIKITGFENIKQIYQYALTVKEYQKKQKYRAFVLLEYDKKLKQLRLSNEDKLIRSESSATTNLQSAQNYLLLSTPELGWINCDRFYNYSTKVDYIVKLKERASLLIVFNSIKSIMSSDINGAFQGVPLNEKITIVGLKTENGKLMMAFHETTITEQPFEGLSFEPVTVKQYKNRLERLNRL